MGIVVDTSKYLGTKRIVVDGNDWEIKLPGAAKELAMNQIQRRVKLLDKKIESGNYNEADLDKYDEYEKYLFGMFEGMFVDGTDNKSVKNWIDKTPLPIIMQVFEDIKMQSEEVISESIS